MPDSPLRTTARIIGPISPRAFRAELPNGKPVVAHLPRPLSHLAETIRSGDSLPVELSAYNLDQARITGPAAAGT